MAEEAKRKYFDPNTHLVNKGGAKFIRMAGLFAKLADDGKSLLKVETEMIQWPTDKGEDGKEFGEARCKARVEVDMGGGKIAVYEGYGDASSKNVSGPQVLNALPRMAESRAIVRALRWATRSEYTAAEEV